MNQCKSSGFNLRAVGLSMRRACTPVAGLEQIKERSTSASRQFELFSLVFHRRCSYVWLRDFLILEADTGARFTKFGILHGGRPTERPFRANERAAGRDLYRIRRRPSHRHSPGRAPIGGRGHVRRDYRRRRREEPHSGRRRSGSTADSLGSPALRQAAREKPPEPQRRNCAHAGANFLDGRGRQSDRAVVVDPACVLRDRQQFCAFHRRVDDDRLRVQSDVAQLRDLPRGQSPAFRGVRPACDGDDHRRRRLSGGNCGGDRAPRPLHEGLCEATESQLHGGGGDATTGRHARRAPRHGPQQHVPWPLHAGPGRPSRSDSTTRPSRCSISGPTTLPSARM